MHHLSTLLLFAGFGHFAILIASALVPQTLNWRVELARLGTLTRQVVWVHGIFIVLVIIGFGVISIVNPTPMCDGSVMSRSVCGFIAIFWAARLVVQFLVFDAKPHLTSGVLKWGYHGLTVMFAYFVLVYGWAAVAPAEAIFAIRSSAP
jgi:hypothetical protein